MKNREKYADKIIKIVLNGETCDFMKNVVIPLYIDGRESSENFCSTNSCECCSKLFAFWLDGDYNKPPTDWVNVPADTLVRVRDNEDDEWVLRYFNRFDEKSFGYREGHNYAVFADGATSVTGSGYIEHWNYCELAEDE